MRGRSGHAWRQLVERLCPPGSYCQVDHCYAPTREIIFGLRPRHPLGPSLDHVVELAVQQHLQGHQRQRAQAWIAIAQRDALAGEPLGLSIRLANRGLNLIDEIVVLTDVLRAKAGDGFLAELNHRHAQLVQPGHVSGDGEPRHHRRPGGGGGGMGTQVAQAGLSALGPAGGVAAGALGTGMSAGFGAGLMGLLGGMLALGVGPGDVCIVPSITFLATANCARFVGAEVVFADVDPQTGLMTPQTLAEALAGMAFVQLCSPGAPVVLGSSLSRSGKPVPVVLPTQRVTQSVTTSNGSLPVRDLKRSEPMKYGMLALPSLSW